jgi:hypothetical protein
VDWLYTYGPYHHGLALFSPVSSLAFITLQFCLAFSYGNSFDAPFPFAGNQKPSSQGQSIERECAKVFAYSVLKQRQRSVSLRGD